MGNGGGCGWRAVDDETREKLKRAGKPLPGDEEEVAAGAEAAGEGDEGDP